MDGGGAGGDDEEAVATGEGDGVAEDGGDLLGIEAPAVGDGVEPPDRIEVRGGGEDLGAVLREAEPAEEAGALGDVTGLDEGAPGGRRARRRTRRSLLCRVVRPMKETRDGVEPAARGAEPCAGAALAGGRGGLSLLAYALGAAVIVAPPMIVLLPVVQDATTAVEDAVDAAIAAS